MKFKFQNQYVDRKDLIEIKWFIRAISSYNSYVKNLKLTKDYMLYNKSYIRIYGSVDSALSMCDGDELAPEFYHELPSGKVIFIDDGGE